MRYLINSAEVHRTVKSGVQLQSVLGLERFSDLLSQSQCFLH